MGMKPPADEGLLPEGPGRFGFGELAEYSGLGTKELTARVWEQVWAGTLVNDGFAALRKGIETGFKPVASVLGLCGGNTKEMLGKVTRGAPF